MLKKVWYNGGITYLLSFGLFILSMIVPIYVVSIILTVIGLIFMGRSLQIDVRHFSKSSSVEKKLCILNLIIALGLLIGSICCLIF